MIYNLVKADEPIARLDNDYNINSGDYVGRIPQWIHQCLADLNIYLGLLPKAYVTTVASYKGTFPDNMKHLIGIEYNGARLDKRATQLYKNEDTSSIPDYAVLKTNIGVTVTGVITDAELDDNLEDLVINVEKLRIYDATSINELPTSNHYYYLLPENRFETSFESGVVIIHYYILPAYYSESLNSLCPYIPDDEAVKYAIALYMFRNILQRGFKHPVFSLGNNKQSLDPYYLYKEARRKAKNSANRFDPDTARIVDAMWQSALYNNIAAPR